MGAYYATPELTPEHEFAPEVVGVEHQHGTRVEIGEYPDVHESSCGPGVTSLGMHNGRENADRRKKSRHQERRRTTEDGSKTDTVRMKPINTAQWRCTSDSRFRGWPPWYTISWHKGTLRLKWDALRDATVKALETGKCMRCVKSPAARCSGCTTGLSVEMVAALSLSAQKRIVCAALGICYSGYDFSHSF
ncbi:hypothetical protein HPB51_004365 [Rhipicephalus microplus]|uniref:Uncharacterized protein n=1 Tax=Rhipicephalus microplus TaxID=6941 RepID=A0A9J6ELW2_RHIMP|nr:hypothetical protein HPB51_004365 [Rhipicephalus microplus]